MRLGWSVEDIYQSCKIDRWFLEQLQTLVDLEAKVKARGVTVIKSGKTVLG